MILRPTSSSAHIFRSRSKKILNQLVVSEDLWERRIAIMATFHYIRRGEFDKTLEISEHDWSMTAKI